MALVKQCNKCGEIKEHSQFAKKTASKDGLQQRCKSCNKVDNLHFRTEINPKHHQIWQKQNSDKVVEIVSRYRKADKNGLIYYIKNPEGKFYVGMTKTHFIVRMIEHRAKWKRGINGKSKSTIPLLWDSFSKWGFDNHEKGILLEFENIDRKTLRRYEAECIKTFKEMGISLNIKK